MRRVVHALTVLKSDWLGSSTPIYTKRSRKALTVEEAELDWRQEQDAALPFAILQSLSFAQELPALDRLTRSKGPAHKKQVSERKEKRRESPLPIC